MARVGRIRSIKPDFWSDGKIKRLPKATALFFIALWNFADDQGIIEVDSTELHLKIPIYRSQDIHKMVNALWKAALIKCSPIDGLAMVSGWSHQRIDRPRDGKYKFKEIKWMTWREAGICGEPSWSDRRKDRIGEDRIGEDGIPHGSAPQKQEPDSKQLTLIPERASPEPTPSAPASSQQIIAVFYQEWAARYGTRAPLLPADHKKLKDLGESLGLVAATDLVRGYFDMPDAWNSMKRHDVQTMISNLSKIQHFVATGEIVTRRDAQAVESTSDLNNQLKRLGGEA